MTTFHHPANHPYAVDGIPVPTLTQTLTEESPVSMGMPPPTALPETRHIGSDLTDLRREAISGEPLTQRRLTLSRLLYTTQLLEVRVT